MPVHRTTGSSSTASVVSSSAFLFSLLLFFVVVTEKLPRVTARDDDAAAAAASDKENTIAVARHAVDEEAWTRLQELGEVTDASDGSLERTFLSPAARRAMDKLEEWMRDAGMETFVDEVGNVHGRVHGADPNAKVLVIGSHLDTVKDAGKYDGALGVIVGIAAVKATVLEAKASGVPIARPMRVVAFCDEEGVRFSSTFLGGARGGVSIFPRAALTRLF